MQFELKFNRRTACKVLGALPFLGWLDPLRAVKYHASAVRYRAHRDGRSLFIMLRDFVRNGVSHEDLTRILGPFEIVGRIDSTSSAPHPIDTTDSADRPDAWCHTCEQRLLALLPDKSIDDWNRSCEPAIYCAACLDVAKQEI